MSDAPPIRPAESPGLPDAPSPGAPVANGGLPDASDAVPAAPRSWWAASLALFGLGTAEGTGGLGVSLAVHGVLLFAMALWAVDSQVDAGGLMLSAFQGAEETSELAVIDALSDPAGGSAIRMAPVPSEFASNDGPGISVEVLTAATGGVAEGAGAGTEEGDGDGDGANAETIILPGGGKGIRKGSFTVWTIPPDPRPMQKYAIVIEVDLPEELRLRRYPKRDLYGEVKGSDSFRQVIPGNGADARRGYLPIRNGKVQFVLGIPGAESLVRDRIKVGSKLLKESQTLELVF